MSIFSWLNRQRKKKPMEAWVQLNTLIGIGEGFVGFFENRITGLIAIMTLLGVYLKDINFFLVLAVLVPAYFFYNIVVKGLVVGRWLEKKKIMQEQAKYGNYRNVQLMEILKTVRRIEKNSIKKKKFKSYWKEESKDSLNKRINYWKGKAHEYGNLSNAKEKYIKKIEKNQGGIRCKRKRKNLE